MVFGVSELIGYISALNGIPRMVGAAEHSEKDLFVVRQHRAPR